MDAADGRRLQLHRAGTAREVVAFVARGGTAKLANLRRLPRATLVFVSRQVVTCAASAASRIRHGQCAPGVPVPGVVQARQR